jgi:hypothetical protein
MLSFDSTTRVLSSFFKILAVLLSNVNACDFYLYIFFIFTGLNHRLALLDYFRLANHRCFMLW